MTANAVPTVLSDNAIDRLDDQNHAINIFCGHIEVESIQPSRLRLTPDHSSFGALDRFPPELLLLIMERLDFQSLSRLSRTSWKGKAYVESLPAFTQMMKHASHVLVALGKTNLIAILPATSFLQQLKSEKCISCFQFGNLLFLPTCERICDACLMLNYSLMMTTERLAQKAFGFTDEQVSQIPVMRTLPGQYLYPRNNRIRLVSMKQVKQLAIQIYGSEKNLAKRLPDIDESTDDEDDILIQTLHGMTLEPPGSDMWITHAISTFSELPFQSGLDDAYAGMAVVLFPSVSGSVVDYGHSCKGCRHVFKEASRHRHIYDRPELIPPELQGRDTRDIILHLEAASGRIYHKADFVGHVKHCHGVPLRLASWAAEEVK